MRRYVPPNSPNIAGSNSARNIFIKKKKNNKDIVSNISTGKIIQNQLFEFSIILFLIIYIYKYTFTILIYANECLYIYIYVHYLVNVY